MPRLRARKRCADNNESSEEEEGYLDNFQIRWWSLDRMIQGDDIGVVLDLIVNMVVRGVWFYVYKWSQRNGSHVWSTH